MSLKIVLCTSVFFEENVLWRSLQKKKQTLQEVKKNVFDSLGWKGGSKHEHRERKVGKNNCSENQNNDFMSF